MSVFWFSVTETQVQKDEFSERPKIKQKLVPEQ